MLFNHLVKLNKAYRPNAHPLDTLMHYNIILHYCYNYYSCINIICNSNYLLKFNKKDCMWCHHEYRLPWIFVCNILELCIKLSMFKIFSVWLLFRR